MLDNTANPNDQSGQTPANENLIPDLWEQKPPTQPKPIHPSRQVSLDPNRQITAAPAVGGVFSPEGDPNALKIPAHASHPTPNLTEVLLQEELKVSAKQAKSLWEHIRNLLALWWWRGPQDGQST